MFSFGRETTVSAEALKQAFAEFIQARNDVLFTSEDAVFIASDQFCVQMTERITEQT